MNDVPLCRTCGLRPRKVRSNGRPLPDCSECWASKANIGDETVNAHGYRRVKTADGWRFKHIVVAEQILGRPLHEDEHISWADGDRSNADPANLLIGVLRFKPLVTAPKRPKDRSGETHKPRTEVRVDPRLRPKLEELAAKESQTLASTARALLEHALLETLPEDERIAYYEAVVCDYMERHPL